MGGGSLCVTFAQEQNAMSKFAHDSKFAQSCIGGKIEVREWAREATDEELRNAFDQVSPTHHFTEILKVERDFRSARATEQRLKAVEEGIQSLQATLSRPEWLTWVFWFTLIGVIITSLSLVRDYLNVQRPDLAPSHVEPATQSTKTSHSDPAALPASEPPASSPVPADTKAKAPTSEPSSK